MGKNVGGLPEKYLLSFVQNSQGIARGQQQKNQDKIPKGKESLNGRLINVVNSTISMRVC